MPKKSAIALLITIVFVMLISVGLGVGLKYINKSSKSLKAENFTLQCVTIVEDFLNILKNSPDLQQVKDADSLAIFLGQASVIPFESSGYRVLISIKSARAKLNPIIFRKKERLEALKTFLLNRGVNAEYADIMQDMLNGMKADATYNSDVFNEHPYLFRDYIASKEHLAQLNSIYKNRYHENSIDKIDTDELFRVGNEDVNASKIDLNYATPLAWELMLGCDKARAEELNSLGFGAYSKESPPFLSDEENRNLNRFNFSYYEGVVAIKIEINRDEEKAVINFEYNIKSKKGYNFDWQV